MTFDILAYGAQVRDEVTAAFDTLAHEYDAWYEKEPLLFAIELEAIRCICPSPGRPALEVGTGSGRFAAAMGLEFGMDPSMTMLKLAKTRGIKTVRAIGERMPFKSGGFGTVFIIFTLCFVKRPLDLFKECFRILRAEGRIVLAFINKNSTWGRVYDEKKKAGHPLYGHAVFYTPADVEKLLAASGFKVEGLCSTLLQPPGQVRTTECPKDGLIDEAGIVLVLGEKC
ncbi:MAG: class I SAM-dependent methyltransferase [Thermodesulfobacteriota bacterium]